MINTILAVCLGLVCLGLVSYCFCCKKKQRSIKNKVVWITGASSGIGRALAIEISKLECVLILSARNKSKLEETKKLCED